jgi:hypothetical protein
LIPLALAVFRDRRIWVLQIPQIKIFLTIGALFLLSTWWNNLIRPESLLPELDETVAWIRAFIVLLGFLVFLLYFVDTIRKIEVIAWFTIALIALSAISAMLPFLQGDEVGRVRADFGAAENSNRLAYMSLFAASLTWFYYSYSKRLLFKSAALLGFFLFIATTLATGSRSGLLQSVILAIIILREQKDWSLTKRIQGGILIASLVVALIAVIPAAQFTRMTTFSSAASAKSAGGKSVRDRLRTIYAALEFSASNPILGIGLGNFVMMHKALYGIENATHNSYLWMLTEGGVGVLLLYLLLFRITYRMLRQLEVRGPPSLLWLSRGLRVNMILLLLFTVFANFWISIFVYLIIGLTLCMMRVPWTADRTVEVIQPAVRVSAGRLATRPH